MNGMYKIPQKIELHSGEWWFGLCVQRQGDVEWKSQDPYIAVVNSMNGNLYGAREGVTTVCLVNRVGQPQSNVCTVVVKEGKRHISKLLIQRSALTLQTGESARLYTRVFPADAFCQELCWESSDENVVCVDEEGCIEAISPGHASVTVTATDGGGAWARCEVTVLDEGCPCLCRVHSYQSKR